MGGERICAVVVTYNRKAMLRECLQGLLSQTRPVDDVVVVNNASSDGTLEMLHQEFSAVQVLTLSENLGASIGFHEGVRWAYEQGVDWIWIMDDDAHPESNCLESLLDVATSSSHAVLVPWQRNDDGQLYGVGFWDDRYIRVRPETVSGPTRIDVFAFVGPLFSANVIGRIGLPRRDFFIWFTDVEYALRVRKFGFTACLVPDAVIAHNYGRVIPVSFLGRKSTKKLHPAWKQYYSARNQLYTITRIHSSFRAFVWYCYRQIRLLIDDLAYYPHDRWQRFYMRLRGILDGLLGRMGKRV